VQHTLAGFTVTLRGTGLDGHLVRARVPRVCSPSAHYAAGDVDPRSVLGRRCGGMVNPGDVFLMVRTGAWPDSDSPMALSCARDLGLVER
jgi:hypothetical protein